MQWCSLAEGAGVLIFMGTNFSSAHFEQTRIRIESAARSIRKLRSLGVCSSDSQFSCAGGSECPFIKDGQCSISPVRPLNCRNDLSPSLRGAFSTKLRQEEVKLLPDAAADAMLLPEVLSYLWQRGAPTKFHNMTPQSWQALLADNSRFIDLAWQDAGADYALLSRALSLPAEGDYHPDFTVLKQHRADHELYDGRIAGDLMPTFFSLYKRRLGSSFDWTTRQFQWCDQRDEGMPYTMWMSDDPQERLMMWEAAKRCRGRVL